MWLDTPYLLCLVVTLAMQLTVCVVAFCLQTDKMTDFAGGSNFIVVALLSFGLAQVFEPRQYMVTGFVCLWALRLVAYLFTRILKTGRDERFDKFRNNFFSFAGFWILQAIWVFVVSLPVMVVNSRDSSTSQGHPEVMTPLDWIGTILFVVGLILETVSDAQKFRYRDNPANRGKFCNTGLWRFSRHPNYFGEVMLWWGVFLAALNVVEGAKWTTILSPLLITVLLLFVSGIPLLERSSDKKYGHLSQYRSYKQSTSPLIPLPPALYKVMPNVVRLVLFFEYPMYVRRPSGMQRRTATGDRRQ